MDIKKNTYQYTQVFASGSGFGVKHLVIFGTKKQAKIKIVEAFRSVFPQESLYSWELDSAYFYNNNYKKEAQALVDKGKCYK